MIVHPPYVGITGFMSSQEITELVSRVPEVLWGERQLMVGVLVSTKTMNGVPNKWPGRYPKIEQFKDIFTDDPRCLNLLHFNTDQPDRLATDMTSLMEASGPNCHGFQLNVPWPQIDQLTEFRQTYPGARVVLQLGSKALDDVTWDPDGLFRKLREYRLAKAMTDVLFDPSGGFGIYSSVEKAMPLLDQIPCVTVSSAMGYGFAGGLRAERLHRLMPLVKRHKRISLDAEGQLRSPDNDPGNNILDLYKAYAYLVGALALFNPEAV